MRPDIDDRIADFIGGFVAAEGCFTRGASGRRFTFEVGLGRSDRGTCVLLQKFLGVGNIYDSRRRKHHYDDQSAFMIQSLRDLVSVVVPFMDAHLPPSHKREQYLDWKARLLEYWEHKAKRPRPCTVEGCEAPRRAHGLCRHHLYEQYRM